jgi:hypothetical protein
MNLICLDHFADVGKMDEYSLVPKLHWGTRWSAKLRFNSVEATKLRGHGRSQVQLGNEGTTELILRQAQDDRLFCAFTCLPSMSFIISRSPVKTSL